MKNTPHHHPGDIPVLGQYDVVVCGGGMAGCGAAIAAARDGADVLLIERLEMLGGLGAAGCVGNFCAAEGGLRGQGRVFDDIVSALHDCGAMGEENGWPVRRNAQLQRENRTFDYRFLPQVLQRLALAANVDLLYATDVIGVALDGRRITNITIHNKSLTQRVPAELFIDATGDGILARHAGGRALPDDPQFPGVIKPSNLMFMRKTSQPVKADDTEPVCTDDTEPDYSIWPDVEGHVALKMKLFHRDLDTSTGRGYSDAVMAMRNEAPHFAAHYRAKHGSSWVYAGAAPMLGQRECCRIESDYVLTIDDCRAGRCFDDAVAYGTFTVDANGTAEILPPYHIPLRSLLVKGVENCLIAGRCFSADRLALSSARTMATSCLMGQAAGIASALAVAGQRPLREVDPADIRAHLLNSAEAADPLAHHLASPRQTRGHQVTESRSHNEEAPLDE